MSYTKKQLFDAIYQTVSDTRNAIAAELGDPEVTSIEVNRVGLQDMNIRIASKTGIPRWFHLKLSEPQ
jgi:hypothetical protein